MSRVSVTETNSPYRLSLGFQNSHWTDSPFVGYISAFIRICIRFMKTQSIYTPRNFYCGKVMLAVPMRAIV